MSLLYNGFVGRMGLISQTDKEEDRYQTDYQPIINREIRRISMNDGRTSYTETFLNLFSDNGCCYAAYSGWWVDNEAIHMLESREVV